MALLCEFTLFNGTACQVPDIFCASTSTCTRNNVTINMALTFMISYVMIHLASQLYNCLVFGIHIVNSTCQICYTLLRPVIYLSSQFRCILTYIMLYWSSGLIFYTLQPCIAVCVTTIVIIVLPAELISIKNLCYSMTEVPHT